MAKTAEDPARRARLAAALRANLRRRKAQARALAAEESAVSGESASGGAKRDTKSDRER